jgi:hypothetical protein
MARISNSSTSLFARAVCVLTSLITLSSFAAIAQKRGGEDEPVFREYRGVQIGMTVEEARKKLGNPKDKGEGQDFFTFNERESLLVGYDKTNKVTLVSVDFQAGAEGIPAAKTVMGSDLEAKTDGSMYKMVRYPKAGFWVAYSRTAGDSPMVSITIQKIE